MPRVPVAPSAPAPASSIDPRLIVHARTIAVAGALQGGLHVQGTLQGGLHVQGTLYPAMPGPNMIRLVLRGQPQPRGGRVELVARMPGMAMAPVKATLAARNGGYGGSVALPMFGRYVVQVDVITPSGRVAGAVDVALPLPQL